MQNIIRQKIIDSLTFSPPPMTWLDVQLPSVPGKAFAVIGMRRSGKTTFLWQCLGDRLTGGAPRESLLYFREMLRHTGLAPKAPWMRRPKAVHSDLDHRLGRHLLEGGFPEAVCTTDRRETSN